MELQGIMEWTQSFLIQYRYFGIFLTYLIGSASAFVPIPRAVFICIFDGLGFDWDTGHHVRTALGESPREILCRPPWKRWKT